MATRRHTPATATERPFVPLQGIELARARAWHGERPAAGPPRLSAAQLTAQLKEQAAEHGLADFEVNGTATDELFELQQAEEDEEAARQQAELASFAGMRTVDSTDNGNAQELENPQIIALFRTQPALVESADQLAAAGGDALKAELDRLGLKCGGTVQMRAERLFLTRNKPRSEWPKAMFAKRKATDGPGLEDRGAKRAQRGPMLPGQSRKAGSVRVPGMADHRREAERPVGRPRGYGAGAAEPVGIYRPST